MSNIILAFDYGKKNTGWAVMKDTALIAYGLWSFEECTSYPQMGETLYGSIANLYSEVQKAHGTPTHLAFENAFRQMGKAAEVFKFLSVMGAQFAYDNAMRPYPVYSTTLKKTATGNGNSDKTETVANINAMYGLTLDVDPSGVDHNAADAIAVGLTCALQISGEPQLIKVTKVRAKKRPAQRRKKQKRKPGTKGYIRAEEVREMYQ